jgi:hypothetical protein
LRPFRFRNCLTVFPQFITLKRFGYGGKLIQFSAHYMEYTTILFARPVNLGA